MLYCVRKIADLYPKLEIKYRSFALGWEKEHFIQRFRWYEAVKPKALSH